MRNIKGSCTPQHILEDGVKIMEQSEHMEHWSTYVGRQARAKEKRIEIVVTTGEAFLSNLQTNMKDGKN